MHSLWGYPSLIFVRLPICPSTSHHCLDPSTVWYMRPASPPPEEAFPSPQHWCHFKACVFHFCLCVSLLYVCACECPERELHLLDPELHEVMSTLVNIGTQLRSSARSSKPSLPRGGPCCQQHHRAVFVVSSQLLCLSLTV